EKIATMDKNQPIYIYCQIGLRGYLAQRILMQNGFDQVNNIAGGFKLWEQCNAEAGMLEVE
ncbi:MAG: FAD-dependent pyridine nucleotide-disulfide, partial [Chitinophagaceae bacterium]